MIPSIAELSDRQRFAVLLELSHDRLAEQLRPYIRSRSVVMTAYWALQGATFGLLAWLWMRAGITFMNGFPTVSLGMAAGWVVLLPIHEHIHAALYRSVGATQVQVHYKPRRLMAYCLADRQVLSGRDFLKVCLGPFLVLNTLLLAATLLSPTGSWQLALGGALLLHVAATSGDIALANALWMWRGRRVWTYDDSALGKSHFLAETGANEIFIETRQN